MLRSKNLGALQRRRALQRADSSAMSSASSAATVPQPEPEPGPEPERDVVSQRKREFLEQAAGSYGYDGRIGAMQQEFPQLAGQVYVDHAGATMHSAKQLQAVFQDIAGSMYTNPHSQHGDMLGERSSTAADAEARRLVLDMCHAPAEEYVCIFTSGATGAMKLVADCFPWARQSMFAYAHDNHNSIVGMREVAMAAGASAMCVVLSADGDTPGPASPLMTDPHAHAHAQPAQGTCLHLLAMPLESNFSGAVYDPAQAAESVAAYPEDLLGELDDLHPSNRWLLLLDAAKACATKPPDLSRSPADFVTLSFYKIFGYPSGLGALVAKRSALAVLRKRYFGGGAVAASAADENFFRLRPGAAGFEDGTSAFLSIAALRHGFAQLQRVGGFGAISQHTRCLSRWLADQLGRLKHPEGQPVACLYGVYRAMKEAERKEDEEDFSVPMGAVDQGPVVTFNLLRPDGSFVGFREVEKMAALNRIHLRTGAFCNPGACAAALGLTSEDVRSNYEAGHVCWDDQDILGGKPTGAVRLSFGYMSTFEDACAVLDMVHEFFVSPASSRLAAAGGKAIPPIRTRRLPHDQIRQDMQAQRSASLSHFLPSLLTSPGSSEAWPEGKPRSSEPDGLGDAAAWQAWARSAAAGSPAAPQANGFMHFEPGSSRSGGSSSPRSPSSPPASQPAQPDPITRLASLWVYPIKSCGGCSVPRWPLGPNGLLLDRDWALVGPDGGALTQKSVPALAKIQPRFDLASGNMIVSCAHMSDGLAIPLGVDVPELLLKSSREASEQQQQQQQHSPVSSSSPEPHSPSSPSSASLKHSLLTEALSAQKARDSQPVNGRANGHSQPAEDGNQQGVGPQCSACGSTLPHVQHAEQGQGPHSQENSNANGRDVGSSQQPGSPHKELGRSQSDKARSSPEKPAIAAKSPLGQRSSVPFTSKVQSLAKKFSEFGMTNGPQRAAEFGANKQRAAKDSHRGINLYSSPRLTDGSNHYTPNPSCPPSPWAITLPPKKDGLGEPAPTSAPESKPDSPLQQSLTVQICNDLVCSTQESSLMSKELAAAAAAWFSEALGQPCRLVRQQLGSRHALSSVKEDDASESQDGSSDGSSASGAALGFANEGQFLLLSAASLREVASRLPEDTGSSAPGKAGKAPSAASQDPGHVARFRPNLVVDGPELRPFEEDDWQGVRIGACSLRTNKPCARCEVVCVDASQGKRVGPEPLLTLARFRRQKGRINFGLLMECESAVDQGLQLEVGMAVQPARP